MGSTAGTAVRWRQGGGRPWADAAVSTQQWAALHPRASLPSLALLAGSRGGGTARRPCCPWRLPHAPASHPVSSKHEVAGSHNQGLAEAVGASWQEDDAWLGRCLCNGRLQPNGNSGGGSSSKLQGQNAAADGRRQAAASSAMGPSRRAKECVHVVPCRAPAPQCKHHSLPTATHLEGCSVVCLAISLGSETLHVIVRLGQEGGAHRGVPICRRSEAAAGRGRRFGCERHSHGCPVTRALQHPPYCFAPVPVWTT